MNTGDQKMRKRIVALLAVLIMLPLVAVAQEQGIKEGLYEAKTPQGEPFTVKLVKDEGGTTKVAYVGYHFEASLRVGQVLLESGKPFGNMEKGKLIFQFPIFLSFSPNPSLLTAAGGKVNIIYYRAEISQKSAGDLLCVLTQIKEPDKQYEGKFTMRNIGLATPPEDKKMQKQYSWSLKPSEKK